MIKRKEWPQFLPHLKRKGSPCGSLMKFSPLYSNLDDSRIRYSWSLPKQITPEEIENHIEFVGYKSVNLLFDGDILTRIRIVSIKKIDEAKNQYQIQFYYYNTVFNFKLYSQDVLETKIFSYVEGDYEEWPIMREGYGVERLSIKGDEPLYSRLETGHLISIYFDKNNEKPILMEFETEVPDNKLIAITDTIAKWGALPTVFTAENVNNENILWMHIPEEEKDYHYYICIATTMDEFGEWNYYAWEITEKELGQIKSGELSVRRILDIVRKRSEPILCMEYEEGDTLYQLLDEPVNKENLNYRTFEGTMA